MREMTRTELRNAQIGILDFVHEFCTQHSIPYWLDGGTLLGAIRHKGYIPWDDDIDIGMLRPDYEKFLAAFNGYSKKYHVVNIDNAPSYHCPFSKVVDEDTYLVELGHDFHVNIDIFIYDNAPDDDGIVKQMYETRDHLRYLYDSRGITNVDGDNSIKRTLKIIRNILIKYLPNSYYIQKIIQNSRKYENQNTTRVGNFLGYSRIACDKKVFDSFIDVEFEGKSYKAPVGYDMWLRSFFNNYMELPPVEKRVTTHSFKAYVND